MRDTLRRQFRLGTSARWSVAVQLFVAIVYGQNAPTFDAASIKKALPQEWSSGAERKMAKQAGRSARPRGGPGTNDPGRIHYPVISVKGLIESAYAITDFELLGPSWLDTETFSIDATMPASTTKEQFRAMLRNLLAERFELTTHTATKIVPAYSLVVSKNGPKLSQAGSIRATATGPDGTPLTVADQLIQSPGPASGSVSWTGLRASMSDLVNRLTEETQRPVIDSTELKDKYDFTITFRRNATELSQETEALPDMFSALQSIGLKLNATKKSIKVIVVDRVDKTPTEN